LSAVNIWLRKPCIVIPVIQPEKGVSSLTKFTFSHACENAFIVSSSASLLFADSLKQTAYALPP
jgi:hypothetical protein